MSSIIADCFRFFPADNFEVVGKNEMLAIDVFKWTFSGFEL